MIEIGLDLSIMKYQHMKHPSIHVQAKKKKKKFDGATIVMQLESVFTVNLIKARCTLLFPDDLFS